MDYSCHWDLEKGVKTMDFNGHAGDIAGLSLSPDMNTYITGSVDKTAKLWDVREQGHKQMFFGHTMDVSSVCVSYPTFAYCSIPFRFAFVVSSIIQAVLASPPARRIKRHACTICVQTNKLDSMSRPRRTRASPRAVRVTNFVVMLLCFSFVLLGSP